jgi:hypothetical protein
MAWKQVKTKPRVQSPTWGQVQKMAEVVLAKLGGPDKAADGLSAESFYALCLLASLKLDEEKAAIPILGKHYIT